MYIQLSLVATPTCILQFSSSFHALKMSSFENINPLKIPDFVSDPLCVCMRAYMCTHMCAHVCICVCVCACVYVHVCIHMGVCSVSAYVFACVYVCMCAYVCLLSVCVCNVCMYSRGAQYISIAKVLWVDRMPLKKLDSLSSNRTMARAT